MLTVYEMTLVNDSVDSWDINTYPLVSDRPCREPSLAQRGLNPKPYTPKLKPAGGGVYDSSEDPIGDAPIFNQKHRIKK